MPGHSAWFLLISLLEIIARKSVIITNNNCCCHRVSHELRLNYERVLICL